MVVLELQAVNSNEACKAALHADFVTLSSTHHAA